MIVEAKQRPMIRRIRQHVPAIVRSDTGRYGDGGQLVKVLVEEAERMLDEGLSVRRVARRTKLSLHAVWSIADRMTGGWKERAAELELVRDDLRQRLAAMREENAQLKRMADELESLVDELVERSS